MLCPSAGAAWRDGRVRGGWHRRARPIARRCRDWRSLRYRRDRSAHARTATDSSCARVRSDDRARQDGARARHLRSLARLSIEARDAGFDAYLTRPLKLQQLADGVSVARGTRTIPAAAPSTPEAEDAGLRGRWCTGAAGRGQSPSTSAWRWRMLTKLGHRVDVAGNGAGGRRSRAPPSRYNIVLMDCQMPEMDGFEAAAAIRRVAVRPMPGPHRCADGKCDGGRSRALPGSGNGRLPRQARQECRTCAPRSRSGTSRAAPISTRPDGGPSAQLSNLQPPTPQRTSTRQA